MHALNEIGAAYSNLEYDLAKGERGGRGVYVESALALLCEAEAATVVNNCAAALLLIVTHFTKAEKRTAKYRRLSFHGANWCKSAADFASAKFSKRAARNCARSARPTRPRSEDYAHAVGPKTALILKVHRSNFFMSGFVESPSSNEISDAGEEEADSVCRRSRQRRDDRD